MVPRSPWPVCVPIGRVHAAGALIPSSTLRGSCCWTAPAQRLPDAARELLLDDDDCVLRGKAEAVNETERRLKRKLLPDNAANA